MSIFLQLTLVGEDVGNTFSLFSNVDGFTTAFETGVSKSSLLAGYTTSAAPALTNTVRIQSTDGVCDNYVSVSLIQQTTTTTTTYVPPVVYDWYELTNCETSAIEYSISYPTGTFALHARVTSGDIIYNITNIVHTNPGGDLLVIIATGFTGCPTTTTTTTIAVTCGLYKVTNNDSEDRSVFWYPCGSNVLTIETVFANSDLLTSCATDGTVGTDAIDYVIEKLSSCSV